ncbi:hypothetical protein HN011_005193 [Eciton burchellii]|nr:hypothetical protein HN011_005193 [Eciton burchellii]
MIAMHAGCEIMIDRNPVKRYRAQITGAWRTGGACNEYRAVRRSIAEIGGDAWWLEGQFRRDASRESKPVGATLEGYTRSSAVLQPNARRLAAKRLDDCVCTHRGNPLNNYPDSIRNHATSRTVAPSLVRLTSPIRDVILFKPFLSVFRNGCILARAVDCVALANPIVARGFFEAYEQT